MHVTDLHRRSVEGFAARVDALDGLPPERWAGPDAVPRTGTSAPCSTTSSTRTCGRCP